MAQFDRNYFNEPIARFDYDHTKVELVNDGPVTILLDSPRT